MLWSGLSYSIQAKDNWNAGDFFSAMFTGALFSSISMGFSTAIGDFLGHEIGSIGKEALRAGLHGAVGGLLSVASGSNFLDGLASGAISSLAGSGMQALGASNPFLLGLGGAVSGGATAALTGGNWGVAAFQGFMVGAFNLGKKPYKPVSTTMVLVNGQLCYELGEVSVTAELINIADFFIDLGAAIGAAAFAHANVDQRIYGHNEPYVDCSYFSREIARKFGFEVGRTVIQQMNWFKNNAYFSIDPTQIQPGDFVFYNGPINKATGEPQYRHVGIASTKNGNLGITHATVNNHQIGSIKFNFIDNEGFILNSSRTRNGWKHIFIGFGRFK